MPADLQKALAGNRDALNNFKHFAQGYRNLYILWVDDAKTEVTRTRRIAEVVARSAINKKLGIN